MQGHLVLDLGFQLPSLSPRGHQVAGSEKLARQQDSRKEDAVPGGGGQDSSEGGPEPTCLPACALGVGDVDAVRFLTHTQPL